MQVDTRGTYTSPEQRFFFPVNNEAIGTPEYCAEDHPKVDMQGGGLIAAEYESVEGLIKSGLQAPLSWRYAFPMGARVTRLFTVEPYPAVEHALCRDQADLRKPENETDIELSDADTIIWKASHVIMGRFENSKDFNSFSDAHLLFTRPAHQPLPLQEGLDPSDMTFEPLGIIKPEGKLITWNGADGNAQWLVDAVVATIKANNILELALVQESLGWQDSLVGTLSCSDTAEGYLNWYAQHKDPEFTIAIEPRDRMRHFDSLTPKQRRRYEKLQNLNSRILNREVAVKL